MHRTTSTWTAATLWLWSAVAVCEDRLEVTVEIAEVLCGESGKPMEVCDNADVAFRSNLVGQGIEEVIRHASSRASVRILTTTGSRVDHEHEVLGGTMTISLAISEIRNEQATIDVKYHIEMPDDHSTQGFTQVLSSLTGDVFPISGGTTTFNNPEKDQTDKVVRVVLLKANRLQERP